MSTAYVLILGIAFLGPAPPSGSSPPLIGGSLTSSEFATEASCNQAGRRAQETFSTSTTRLTYLCTAK